MEYHSGILCGELDFIRTNDIHSNRLNEVSANVSVKARRYLLTSYMIPGKKLGLSEKDEPCHNAS